MYIPLLILVEAISYFLRQAPWEPEDLERDTSEKIIFIITCLENALLSLELEIIVKYHPDPHDATISRASNESVLGIEGLQWTISERSLKVKYTGPNPIEALDSFILWVSV